MKMVSYRIVEVCSIWCDFNRIDDYVGATAGNSKMET